MKKIILLALSFLVTANAQFDSLIFTKEMRLNGYSQEVDGTTIIFPLGDQNNDGFDDIMLYDCGDKSGYVYFGGNPIDTIAVNSIQFFDSIYVGGQIAVIDINNDGINDIVASSVFLSDSGYYYLGPIRIYYGGEVINPIPDLIFNPPPGAKSSVPIALKDFNGPPRAPTSSHSDGYRSTPFAPPPASRAPRSSPSISRTVLPTPT